MRKIFSWSPRRISSKENVQVVIDEYPNFRILKQRGKFYLATYNELNIVEITTHKLVKCLKSLCY